MPASYLQVGQAIKLLRMVKRDIPEFVKRAPYLPTHEAQDKQEEFLSILELLDNCGWTLDVKTGQELRDLVNNAEIY